MILLPLGVGGAYTEQYYHSNLLITVEDTQLLIDAGTTLRYSLSDAQIDPASIDSIFITHFHHDHVGGLAEFLSLCYWQFKEGIHTPHQPVLYLRPSQLAEIEGLLSPSLNNQGLRWQDYCTPKIIVNDFIADDNFSLQILPTDTLHCAGLKSCGVKIILPSQLNIIISGDIKKLDDSQLLSFVDSNTQAIIQDLCFIDNAVHSSYEEVIEYYPAHLLDKVLGIHYDDKIQPDGEYLIKLLRQGFPINFEL